MKKRNKDILKAMAVSIAAKATKNALKDKRTKEQIKRDDRIAFKLLILGLLIMLIGSMFFSKNDNISQSQKTTNIEEKK